MRRKTKTVEIFCGNSSNQGIRTDATIPDEINEEYLKRVFFFCGALHILYIGFHILNLRGRVMVAIVMFKKSTFMKITGFLLLVVLAVAAYSIYMKTSAAFANEEYLPVVQEIVQVRDEAMLAGDIKSIEHLYNTKTKYGTWAYEQEVRKVKYLKKWSDKQGVTFIDIKSVVIPRRIRSKGSGFSAYFTVSTEYKYVYNNDPMNVNSFRIGTYHILDTAQNEAGWMITKEWYTDPFADSLNLDDIKTEEIKTFITTQTAKDLSGLNERRVKAVEYARKYCGAASTEENGFKYNKKYRDYNPLGGDCANFASQILFEGGKFRKTGGWNYDRGGATRAWVNAGGFKDYMLYSGRASIIASGTYNKVYKAAYKLLPGDFIAYEKKGDVTHVSIVTGIDSRGYPLVTCHNTDRNNVPWDLGWSNKNIKFYLIRVHF